MDSTKHFLDIGHSSFFLQLHILSSLVVAVCDSLVVSVDGLFDIGHATVAYFNSVAVEYFV